MAYNSPLMVSLDQGMSKIERALNLPGYIPVVSSFTGPIRVMIGKVEMIASLFIGVIVLLSTGSLDRAVAVILEYGRHGGANIIRGLIEFVPIFGNILCVLYDDGARMHYQYEGQRYASIY